MKKYELITLSMYLLGGDDKALDIEDIAMKCEELFPGVFAWRKYKNQVNLELVGFAMRDAKKEQYGKRVSGSHAKGWRLTSNGIILVKEILKKDKKLKNIFIEPTKHKNLELNRINKELKRVRESQAYLDWDEDKCVHKSQLGQLLRINAYSSKDSVEIKIARLSKLLGVEDGIDSFINYVISNKEDLI